ncbi:MAG: acyltransferase [Solirubrobacteraceae bacterium]|nr:acyltransferase [Solirubrobacteraceae bacterium]
MRRAVLMAVLALLVLAATQAGGASQPRCFGAASRDPLHPCDNPRLRHTVVPSPSDALILPNSPCDPDPSTTPYFCTFGSPTADAKATVALIGDSHATHWRAALLTVASRDHWHGLSITRSSCPFTKAVPLIPQPARSQCTAWNAQVVAFVDAHPEITTVFVSEHRGGVVVPSGLTARTTQIRGYIAAWRELPATVRHVIVIRDTPYDRTHTGDCVERALHRHEEPGLVCAIPRAKALKTDPAALAARRVHGSRVDLVDMSHYMCSDALCYPVVGGVLVHKDVNHIGVTFGTTMGPYLLRAVNRLLG